MNTINTFAEATVSSRHNGIATGVSSGIATQTIRRWCLLAIVVSAFQGSGSAQTLLFEENFNGASAGQSLGAAPLNWTLSDGDGFSDGHEASHGTNPNDSASRSDASFTIYTAVEVRLDSAQGQSYRIESSTDLRTWTPVEEHNAGTGGTVTRFYSIQEIPKRFFRPVRE